MLHLSHYISNTISSTQIYEEEDTSKRKEDMKEIISNIKWDMWEESGVKTNWLKDNYTYNKIQYIYRDKKEGIEICFLLGYTDNRFAGAKSASSWKMWVGKVGAISYSEDWEWDLKTDQLNNAITKSCDIIADFVMKVKEDKDNYVAYYVHI